MRAAGTFFVLHSIIKELQFYARGNSVFRNYGIEKVTVPYKERVGIKSMKKDDMELSVELSARNSHDEMEILNSCISRYFRGKSESRQLKEQESTILSVLSIYFHGHAKI